MCFDVEFKLMFNFPVIDAILHIYPLHVVSRVWTSWLKRTIQTASAIDAPQVKIAIFLNNIFKE
jgi:hypothetical protein